MPSGLIDEGENIATAALRELKEETGYIATVSSSSSSPSSGDSDASGGEFIMHNDPGFCNTNTRMLFVDVDMSDPQNQNPAPELEESEYIETFTIPLSKLWSELVRLDREGYAVDARVGTLAQGWEMARRWRGVLG